MINCKELNINPCFYCKEIDLIDACVTRWYFNKLADISSNDKLSDTAIKKYIEDTINSFEGEEYWMRFAVQATLPAYVKYFDRIMLLK